MDMAGVVVLFDEMDALVQKRDAETSIEIESKFLTTYMLPKLAKLHDRGQLAFLMATNFQASFDDAIKREGRFDFLLCMGPPILKAKCGSIHVFFEADNSIEETEETKKAGKLILERAAGNAWLADQLTLYTFGEFKSFISAIGGVEDIGTAVEALNEDGFLSAVKEHSKSVSLKLNDLDVLKKNPKLPKLSKWKRLRDLDRLDFGENDLREKADSKIPVIKYVLDRKQSRRQCVKLPAKA
jgi:SpoVK/Ycf46/Vps4 family AAA+-type ATPase